MIQTTHPVGAVLVTYHPQLDTLTRVLRSLCPQVGQVELVDNTPDDLAASVISEAVSAAAQANVTVHRLGMNRGIGYAQNLGIGLAQERGCEFVILSDQDTLFPRDCVDVLVGALHRIEQQGTQAAAIGPAYVDSHASGQRPFFLGFDRGWTSRIHGESGCVEVSGVIASGMLIRLSALPQVGLMNEALFIDWVDFEWCWRAIASGHRIIGCFDTVIDHQFGDDPVRIGPASFSIRSPIRSYYIVRNGIFLATRSRSLPIMAAMAVGYRAIKWSILACLLGRPRLKQAAHVMRGIFHGLAGHIGPMDRAVRADRTSGH